MIYLKFRDGQEATMNDDLEWETELRVRKRILEAITERMTTPPDAPGPAEGEPQAAILREILRVMEFSVVDSRLEIDETESQIGEGPIVY